MPVMTIYLLSTFFQPEHSEIVIVELHSEFR